MAEVQPNFVTLDVETQNSTLVDNLSTPHTVGVGTDVMVVNIVLADDRDISVANWNSSPMTLLTNFYSEQSGAERIAVYYVVAPTGSHNVDFTLDGNGRFAVTIIDFAGVNQENPINLDSVFTKAVTGDGHVETGFTNPTRLKGRFLIDFMIAGGTLSGYEATAPPFEDGGDNGQINLDGRAGNIDRNGSFAASGFGCSYKAGTLGRQINSHMGWEHTIYGANRNWGYVAFTMNPGEEEIEFIGGPLGLTDHLQLPGRVREM
jgi:hypothetical protein